MKPRGRDPDHGRRPLGSLGDAGGALSDFGNGRSGCEKDPRSRTSQKLRGIATAELHKTSLRFLPVIGIENNRNMFISNNLGIYMHFLDFAWCSFCWHVD